MIELKKRKCPNVNKGFFLLCQNSLLFPLFSYIFAVKNVKKNPFVCVFFFVVL